MNFKKENILKAHKNGCEEIKEAIETMAPELFSEKEKTYSVGAKVKFFKSGNTYELRPISFEGDDDDDYSRVGFVQVTGHDIGYVWTPVIAVYNIKNITRTELTKMLNLESGDFKFVKE